MRRSATAALCLTLSLLVHSKVLAQVIPIDQVDTGFFVSTDPTMTFFWPAEDSKAVLIFIPGGSGSIGIKPGVPDLTYHFFRTLRRLSDSSMSSGKIDVVIFDSPKPLDAGATATYIPQRTSADHLIRIQSVVEYYRNKLNKPVWLLGHSNGTFSLSEFSTYLAKKQKSNLVSGWIFSGSLNSTSPRLGSGVPVLFLHHQSDSCPSTTPAAARQAFESLKQAGQSRIEYVSIESGAAESKHPCYSGFHMYFGGGEEVATAIERFVLKESQ